ncbi:hypothetical protein KL935_002126 [Ogataea polymorpha]|nr:hypothetical protein KL937_001544 [Ogataea polymorpha]KAG7894212.1 hypothetical protein KL908_002489 [Ogataea polymorpha]KAG7902166.1 hypothetical protein KL935_002126 [Ogataea polymorpha]KAG7939011.1 hypothetical protein KL904_001540 [Ogataea polymorpha]
MGSQASKIVEPKFTPVRSANDDDELLLKLQARLGQQDESKDAPLSLSNLSKWEANLLADPKNRLALNCFTSHDITEIVAQTAAINLDNVDLFNVNVKFEGAPITNQKSSGRCWLFASTNVFKEFIKAKHQLESFEFSQNYLFFYDKLEKSNWFLNRIIESADEEIDSRLVQYLMQTPENDGGQWDMVVNLVKTYGLVPKSVYPDSASSISSSGLNYLVNNKLREFALVLRKLSTSEKDEDIEGVKTSMLNEIFNILALTLGLPPKPDDEITWEYKDKFGSFHSVKTTPLGMYSDLLGFDAAKYFSLIHDPRNTEGLYTVDKLGNIEGGKPIEYVNTSIDNLKQAAIAMLHANHPVFFGCDVGKFGKTDLGLLDVDSWDYQLGFGTDMHLNKKQRLMTGSSQMTHAMVLVGVHLVDGKPVRWKVENSWGEYGAHKGYYVMSDKWFDEYVFQIVMSERFAPAKLSDIWKSKDYKVLPYYDPMGALA